MDDGDGRCRQGTDVDRHRLPRQQPDAVHTGARKRLIQQNLKGHNMWYFAWALGIGFAVQLAILNAIWGDNEDARELSLKSGSHDRQN
jgi:cyd operon protein YbgT